MKFKVRSGFVVYDTVIEQDGEGKPTPSVSTYVGGKSVDLPEERAVLHAHKLEPADDDAAAFLEAMHRPADPTSVPLDAASLAKMISEGITSGLAALVAAQAAASKAGT